MASVTKQKERCELIRNLIPPGGGLVDPDYRGTTSRNGKKGDNNKTRNRMATIDTNDIQVKLKPEYENHYTYESVQEQRKDSNDILAKLMISLAIQLSRTVDQLQRMERIKKLQKADEKNNDKIINPWKIIGKIADKFFLVFFFSVVVLMNFIMFVIIPLV